jgi:ribosomal protein S18 acetylase RimI-like enzyme
VAADGGRLKLEWSTLRSRPADEVSDLLWWEDGELLGFLGVYGFRPGWCEVTGMVAPDARRRGIGRALFTQALPLVRARAAEHLLMVVPRNSPAGGDYARAFGMTYEHSEHALRLGSSPEEQAHDSGLELRGATRADIPVLSRLYLDGFGDGEVDERRLGSERSVTLMIERGGQAVGTLAISREGGRSAIYGFVVDAELRGRGIGREVLRRVCRDEFAGGVDHVDLEVEVENDRALGLYTSVGFQPVATEDYYELLMA